MTKFEIGDSVVILPSWEYYSNYGERYQPIKEILVTSHGVYYYLKDGRRVPERHLKKQTDWNWVDGV